MARKARCKVTVGELKALLASETNDDKLVAIRSADFGYGDDVLDKDVRLDERAGKVAVMPVPENNENSPKNYFTLISNNCSCNPISL